MCGRSRRYASFRHERRVFIGRKWGNHSFAVSKGDLPPGSHALIGNQHLKDLLVSLDFVQFRGEVEIGEAISFGKSFASRSDQSTDSFSQSRSSLAPVSKLLSVCLDIPLLCLAIVLLSVLATCMAISFGPTTLLSTAMEPQALVVSLVCLFFARVFWLSRDLVLLQLSLDTRSPTTEAFVCRRDDGCKLAPSLSPAQRRQC